MIRNLSFFRELVAFLRGYADWRRTRHDPILLEAALREVRAARAARDTRRQHAAIERAKAARTAALRREIGMRAAQ